MTVKKKRQIKFAKISVPFNALMAAGKFIFGIISASFFLCINALYNVGIGTVKYIAVKTHNSIADSELTAEEKPERQLKSFKLIGVFLLITGMIYVLYCVKMFVVKDNTVYRQTVAIAIAAFTFFEIFISAAGVSKMRKEREPMLEALKLINLAASLVSLVLTQTALLSFAYEGDASFYNGISGIIFGSCAALIGAVMVIRKFK